MASPKASSRPWPRQMTAIFGSGPLSAYYDLTASRSLPGTLCRVSSRRRTSAHFCPLRTARLWIGTALGLASLKDGALTQYPAAGDSRILGLVEDTDGVLWVAAYGAQIGRLCAIRTGRVECFGADGSFGRGPFGLYRDRMNRIWAGVRAGVWRWTPAPPQFYSVPGETFTIQGLVDDEGGALNMMSSAGIRRLEKGTVGPPVSLPDRLAGAEANDVLRDRDGGLWIGTGHGLAHLHNGRTDVFQQSDGLSSDRILSLYKDREGSVWVATADGLDRFRHYAVTRLTAREGLSGSGVMSVLATKDGSVWIATNAGLNRFHGGRIAVVDVDRAHDMNSGGRVGTALFQDSRGRLWVADAAEVGYLENGRWVGVNGIPRGQPFTVVQDTDENIWIYTKPRVSFAFRRRALYRRSPGADSDTMTRRSASSPMGDWVGCGWDFLEAGSFISPTPRSARRMEHRMGWQRRPSTIFTSIRAARFGQPPRPGCSV